MSEHRYASTTDGAVYLVDPALATALAVDAGSFRQRRPFPARDEDVDRVRVDVRGHPSFVMTRDGDEWRLERPWHDRARSSAVRDLVESLTRLELRAFGDGGSASRVLAVVEVGVAGRTWTPELLAPTGDGAYRVRRADGSLEGTVAAWDAERLLEDPSRFLDLRLVYASNPDVLALEFRRGTNTTTLRRAAPGRPWRVGGASAAEGPGAAEMEAWLQRLRGLRATDLGPVARPLEPAGAVVLDGANRRLGTLEYRESADGPIVVRSSWRPGVILLLDASDRDALRPPSTFGGEAAP